MLVQNKNGRQHLEHGSNRTEIVQEDTGKGHQLLQTSWHYSDTTGPSSLTIPAKYPGFCNRSKLEVGTRELVQFFNKPCSRNTTPKVIVLPIALYGHTRIYGAAVEQLVREEHTLKPIVLPLINKCPPKELQTHGPLKMAVSYLCVC